MIAPESRKVRVLVVDDEPPARELMTALLARESDLELLACCASGQEAVEAVTRLRPDLLFLDIQMPGMDGFGVLSAIPSEHMPLVVFVTAYDRHAVRAFEHAAIDYVLKPFEFDRIHQCIERVRERLASQWRADMVSRLEALLGGVHAHEASWERIAVKDARRTVFVRPSDIDWVESDGNYVRLHVGRGSHLHRETLVSLESRLVSRGFVRVSRSALVNLDRVREWRPLFHGDSVLILDNGVEVQASRTYREALEQRLQ